MITSSYSITPPQSSRLNNLPVSIRSLESPLATQLIDIPIAKQSIPLHKFKQNKFKQNNHNNNHNSIVNHTHYYPHYNKHLEEYNNKNRIIPTTLTPYVQKLKNAIFKLFKILTNMYMFIGLFIIIFILIILLVNKKNKLIKLSELVTKLKI